MPEINITEVDPGGARAEELVLEVLRSGRLASGPMVERLEAGFVKLTGAEHAVAVNNGTTALVGAIEALQIGPGDEVITTPFTFVATLNAILEAGATARFVDIGDDFNIDPALIEERITDRTRAIMPVHLYGQCADMDPIVELANAHELHIIEDSAQSHGATYKGRGAGSFGVGTFSLYATKNMTTGEGGMVTTNDAAVADRLRVLRNQGMRARYQYELAGHNWRLTDLQAALGVAQFDTLPAKTAARAKNAAALSERLAGVGGLQVPQVSAGRTHVWHQYTVRVLPDATITREELQEALAASGVASGIYYPKVVFDYDCYADRADVVKDPAPVAFETATQVLSLPVHPNLSESDLDVIAGSIATAMA